MDEYVPAPVAKTPHLHPPVRSGHHLRDLLPHGPPDAGGADSDVSDASIADSEAPEGNTPFGNFWWIGASNTDTSGLPNTGVQFSAEVLAAPPEGASGGCIDYWTSDTLSNGMWGQIGYSLCTSAGGADSGDPGVFAQTAFVQVWNLDAPDAADGQILLDQETTSITPGLHNFSMYAESGTVWAYAVDGHVFVRFDMGMATADVPYGIATTLEEGDGVPAAFVPPSVQLPVAMTVQQGGKWSPAAVGVSYNTAGLSGVVGNLQDPTLANDQIIIGGDAATLDGGTPLWKGTTMSGGLSTTIPDGGKVDPPFLWVTCPPPNATVGGTVPLAANAASASGLAGVAFFVDTSAGFYVDAGGASEFFDGGADAAAEGGAAGCLAATAPYSCSLDTTSLTPGPHFIDVVAFDKAGTETFADYSFFVLPDAGSSACLADAAAPVDAGADTGSKSKDSGSREDADRSSHDAAPTHDAMAHDGGGSGPSGAASPSAGCGCRTAAREGAPQDRTMLAALAAIVWVFVSRRRRRSTPMRSFPPRGRDRSYATA